MASFSAKRPFHQDFCCLGTVLGCVQKSVELPVHRPSLYAYEPLRDRAIGGFPQILVKEKSLSNSWR